MYLLGRSHMFKRLLECRVRKLIHSEDGSVAVLTIGLFVVLLSTALILTNISSVYLAKRSLSFATEAAVQRGMKNLDAESYYSGEYNAWKALANIFAIPEEDPGIPIDCEAGARDVREVLSAWARSQGGRSNLHRISVTDFQCDGYQIYIETAAEVTMPARIPFIDFDSVAISTYAGAVGERAETNNYSGFDIG